MTEIQGARWLHLHWFSGRLAVLVSTSGAIRAPSQRLQGSRCLECTAATCTGCLAPACRGSTALGPRQHTGSCRAACTRR